MKARTVNVMVGCSSEWTAHVWGTPWRLVYAGNYGATWRKVGYDSRRDWIASPGPDDETHIWLKIKRK